MKTIICMENHVLSGKMETMVEEANRKVPIDVRAGTRARLQIVKHKMLLRSADATLNSLIDFWEQKEGMTNGGNG